MKIRAIIKRVIVAACLLAGAGIMVCPQLAAPVGMDSLDAPYLPPGPGHIFGTNGIGQDVFSELIYGARISIGAGLLSALLATAAGTLAGSLAGYFGKMTDAVLMRTADMFLVIPGLPLAIVLAAAMGPSFVNIIIVISVLSWPATARIVRAQVMGLRDAGFVLNAKGMGGGGFYIIFKHILPNAGEVIAAKAVLAAAGGMLAEAGLAFMGMGDPDYQSWGGMIHDAFAAGALINGAYWRILPPVLCICAAVLALILASGGFFRQSGATPFSPAHLYPRPLHDFAPPDPRDHSVFRLNKFSITFTGRHGEKIQALKNVSLEIHKNEKAALIGLSGSGKSLLLLSIMGIRIKGATYKGDIFVKGTDIQRLSVKDLQDLRREMISYIPQGAGAALNPVIAMGPQMTERFLDSKGLSKTEILDRIRQMLKSMGMTDPEKILQNHPHRLSGGMKQRALAAMALAGTGDLVLADEPTKALDPGNRKQMVDAFNAIKARTVLVVTHDLDFAKNFADRIIVLHEGEIVEQGGRNFFQAPNHPFSRALLAAAPKPGWKPEDVGPY